MLVGSTVVNMLDQRKLGLRCWMLKLLNVQSFSREISNYFRSDLMFVLSWHWIWRLNRAGRLNHMTVIVPPSHGRGNSTSTKQLLADASPWNSHAIMIANDGLRNAILGFFFSGLEMCKNLPRLEKWLNWQWNHRSTITWRSLVAASNFLFLNVYRKGAAFGQQQKSTFFEPEKPSSSRREE